MKKIEKGQIARYVGSAHPGLCGCIVKVLGSILDDDGRPTDAYEVQPYLEKEGRFSWVTSDAEADELKPVTKAEAVKYDRDDPTYIMITKKGDDKNGEG